MENEKLLRFGEIKPLAWKFAIPSIVSMVVWSLYNLVDRIYVGNIPGVGSLAITGLGLTLPVTTFAFAFAMLIAVGGSTLISIKLGEQKKAEANRIFTNGIELAIMIGTFITVATWILLKPLLRGLGADEATMPFAYDYIVIVIGGFLVSGLSFFLIGCLRAVGHPRAATGFNVLGTAINLLLDPILIFALSMGIKGAAWATLFSQVVTFLAVVFFFWWKRSDLPLRIKKPNFRLDKTITGRMFALGFAPFAVQLVASLIIILLNQIMKTYGGNEAIAALTIVFGVETLMFLPLIGYVQGQQPIIGFNYGAKAYNRVREVIKYATKMVLIFGVIAFVLVQVWPHVVVRAFTQDPALQEMTIRGLRLFMLMLPIFGLQILGSNYFQFTGKPKMAAVLSLLRQVIVFIPCLLILPRFFGVDGVWYSGIVADFVSTVITTYFFVKAVRLLPRKDESFTVKNEVEGEKELIFTQVEVEAAKDAEIQMK